MQEHFVLYSWILNHETYFNISQRPITICDAANEWPSDLERLSTCITIYHFNDNIGANYTPGGVWHNSFHALLDSHLHKWVPWIEIKNKVQFQKQLDKLEY